MKEDRSKKLAGVIFLTLLVTYLLSGCSIVNRHYGELCNSHAYVRTTLNDYISNRFHNVNHGTAPVRMAVIPFSVPANISSQGSERPGLGNQLAWKIQAHLLAREGISIIEVLNREDWPGKKDEFFTGNFGALALAREAGYDLVLVGYLESLPSLEVAIVDTKVIETESGVTLWYGKTTVSTLRRDLLRATDFFGIQDRRPDLIYTSAIVDRMAKCVVADVMKEEQFD